jgi:hypothetical protein
MNEAQRITQALGGDWRGGSGLAPCPVCQPEGRRDQRALSLSDNRGGAAAPPNPAAAQLLPSGFSPISAARSIW